MLLHTLITPFSPLMLPYFLYADFFSLFDYFLRHISLPLLPCRFSLRYFATLIFMLIRHDTARRQRARYATFSSYAADIFHYFRRLRRHASLFFLLLRLRQLIFCYMPHYYGITMKKNNSATATFRF